MADRARSFIDLDGLAKLIGVEPWDKFWERSEDSVFSNAWKTAEMEIRSEDPTADPDSAQARADEYYLHGGAEIFRNYRSALITTVEEMLGEADLILTEISDFEFKIDLNEVSWAAPLRVILDTINGVGSFEFASTADFLASGPYTAKQAVLEHLHWLKRRPEVYGDSSYAHRFEQRLR